MNNKLLVLSAILASVILSGCATNNKLYDYGDYTEAYYDSKKEPTEENVIAWKEELESIRNDSMEDKNRVPPGISANLGYLSLQQQNYAKAIEYFSYEKSIYPESAMFMKRLIQKAEKLQSQGNK
jgi:hypothetical protein